MTTLPGQFGVVRPATSAGNAWQRALIQAMVLLTLFAMLAVLGQRHFLVLHFLLRQDLPVLAIMACLMLWANRRALAPTAGARAPDISGRQVAAIALLGMGLTMVGHQLVMSGYALSRDEQLALFSAEAIQNGRLYGLISEPWAQIRPALNMTFMAENGPANIWMPVYLNGNGLIHALAGLIIPVTMTNAVLGAIGLIATWGVARQLWPGQRDLHFVALLLFALSTQRLAADMTSYAMTGHLTLNMAWLWLFVKDRPWSHALAMLVALLVTGLHQLPFHPLVAAPILATLVFRRRWRLAAFYAVAYAFILLFWLSYLKIAPFAPPPGAAVGQGATRIASMASGAFHPSLFNLTEMGANLLRFFAWQHLLLLPLMLAGARAAWRTRDPLQLALLASFLLMIAMRLVLRPYQGHGWGFRYMHGLIGIACLIATLGWHDLRRRGLIGWPQLRVASLATALLAMPWLLVQTHVMVRASAVISERIDRQTVDAVIIADRGAPFAADLVFNRPDLDNRPIRLMASALDDGDLRQLCASKRLGLMAAKDLAGLNRYFRIDGTESPSVIAPAGCLQALAP